MKRPRFTHHARLRMAARGITTREVRRVLWAPEVDYVQQDRSRAAGVEQRVAQRGDVGVAYEIEPVNGDVRPVVITVLYRDPADYEEAR